MLGTMYSEVEKNNNIYNFSKQLHCQHIYVFILAHGRIFLVYLNI